MKKLIHVFLMGMFLIFFVQGSLLSWERSTFSVIAEWGEGNLHSGIFFPSRNDFSHGNKIAENQEPDDSTSLYIIEPTFLLQGQYPDTKSKIVRSPVNIGSVMFEILAGTMVWYGTVRMVGGGLTALTVSSVSCALIVYAMGSLGKIKGSFLATLGGSVIGTAAFIAGVMAMWNSSSSSPMGIIFFAFPALGATLGFNATRRYKSTHQQGSALLNVKNNKLCLSFPAIHVYPSLLGKSVSLSCALLNVEL